MVFFIIEKYFSSEKNTRIYDPAETKKPSPILWVGVFVLGYCGNNSQKVSYLYIQVLVYRLERAKTTSGRPLSTKNCKARKSGEREKKRRTEKNGKSEEKRINEFLTRSIQ